MRWIYLLLICAFTHIAAEKITVIGVGRLGLCLALCLEKAGYEVLGVDLSPDYVAQINEKTLQSPEPQVEEYLAQSKRFRATTSLDEGLQFSKTYFIALPTNPPSKLGQYNCELLDDLLAQINERKVKNKHFVIVSTLFPGYVRDVATPKLIDCPGAVISYSPEFIAQGAIIQGLENPDLILIGEGNAKKGKKLATICQKICNNQPNIARMSPESAEIMKLSLNCFVTMKIAFANLIGDIADATAGADKGAILKALGSDSRVGSKCLSSGYGFGGPCFPRDNRALGDYATLLGLEPTLFRATDKANQLHAEFMASQLLLEDQEEYEFEDVCYKPHCPIPIIEESQKLEIAKKLANAGKKVTIKDRSIVIAEVQKQFGDIFEYKN